MSKIRTCFTSRFATGYIVEADFSQLEVVVQAMLTKSKNLIADLVDGKDMHKERASKMFDVPVHLVTPEQRQLAKACSFQLAYGAGYKSMAEKLKISEKLTRKFVEDFYKRYPEIADYNSFNKVLIEKTSTPTSSYTKLGKQLRRGFIYTPLQHKYSFLQKEWQDSLTFSPTEISNYPVQGTAADLVALFRARLYRGLLRYNAAASLSQENLDANIPRHTAPISAICTVHDSVVFDVENLTHLGELTAMLDCLLSNFSLLLREHFPELATPVQLRMDVKFGKDWMAQEKLISLPTGEFL